MSKEETAKVNARSENGEHSSELNKELARKIAQIKKALHSAGRNELRDRFKVACYCQEVVEGEGNTYGKHAVKYAAKELNRSRKWVYCQARIAQVCSQEDLNNLLSTNNGEGPQLSWSHFEELSRVENTRSRKSLFNAARRKSWSVRDLKEQVNEVLGYKAAKPDNPPPTPSAKSSSRPSADEVGNDAGESEAENDAQAAPVDDLSAGDPPDEPDTFDDVYEYFNREPDVPNYVAEDRDEAMFGFLESLDRTAMGDHEYGKFSELLEFAEERMYLWRHRHQQLARLFKTMQEKPVSAYSEVDEAFAAA